MSSARFRFATRPLPTLPPRDRTIARTDLDPDTDPVPLHPVLPKRCVLVFFCLLLFFFFFFFLSFFLSFFFVCVFLCTRLCSAWAVCGRSDRVLPPARAGLRPRPSVRPFLRA